MSWTLPRRPPATMISNVIDALPVPQSQSRFAPYYHHRELHIGIRTYIRRAAGIWSRLHAINLLNDEWSLSRNLDDENLWCWDLDRAQIEKGESDWR